MTRERKLHKYVCVCTQRINNIVIMNTLFSHESKKNNKKKKIKKEGMKNEKRVILHNKTP